MATATKIISDPEASRAMRLQKIILSNKLRTALLIARERIRLSRDVPHLAKQESLQQLDVALSVLKDSYSGIDVPTRTLFPYHKENMSAVDGFVANTNFFTLGAIVGKPFSEIEDELHLRKLLLPIALQTFYEVYHELLAEEARPAKSST